MQIITNNAGKELKKHGDSAFPFLVSYERLSGYETGSFLWHWHPEIELTYIHKGEIGAGAFRQCQRPSRRLHVP